MKKIIALCGLLCAVPTVVYSSETKQKQETTIPEAPPVPDASESKTKAEPYRTQTTEIKKNVESTKGEKRKTPLHDVMIFLNHGLASFSKNDNITTQFVLALCQKCAPIIVSGNVLKNVIEHAKQDEFKDSFKKFVDSFKNSFNDWLVYKTEIGDFYLFVPKAYQEKMRAEVDTESLEKAIKSKGYKLDNVLRGFDVWHLTPVKTYDEVEPKQWIQQSELNIENLKSLFVAKKDDVFGLWNIYISGHGTLSKAVKEAELFAPSAMYQTKTLKESAFSDAEIAGMKLNQFRDLIQFFNDKINTNFLFYSTCYAGGFNKFLPYAVNIMNAQGAVTGAKKPNFVVGVGSISDAPVWYYTDLWAWCLSCTDANKGNICSNGTIQIDYRTFFDLLHDYTKKEGVRSTIFTDQELKKMCRPVTPRVIENKDKGDHFGISGLPQFMFPGADIFIVLDLFDEIAVINNVMAKKYAREKKPIIINSDKKVLLLCTDTVDELELSNDVPIISMLPVPALLRFNKITSPGANLASFWNKCIKSANSYKSNDAMYIDTLLIKNKEFERQWPNVIVSYEVGASSQRITGENSPQNKAVLDSCYKLLFNYCLDHSIDYETFDKFFTFDDSVKKYILFNFLQEPQAKKFFKEKLKSAEEYVLPVNIEKDLTNPAGPKIDKLEIYLNKGGDPNAITVRGFSLLGYLMDTYEENRPNVKKIIDRLISNEKITLPDEAFFYSMAKNQPGWAMILLKRGVRPKKHEIKLIESAYSDAEAWKKVLSELKKITPAQ